MTFSNFIFNGKKPFVIQGIVVNFDESLLHSYGKVIEHLKKIFRSWVYPDNVNKSDNIPSIVTAISRSIKEINIIPTFCGNKLFGKNILVAQ